MKMTRSDVPTNHILVMAHTNSTWDSVDYALITLNGDDRDVLRSRSAMAVDVATQDDDFASLTFYDIEVDFYIDIDEYMALLGDDTWCFVSVPSGAQQFSEPGQRLGGHTAVFDGTGAFKYSVTGKDTGEEFWTSDLPVEEITKQ